MIRLQEFNNVRELKVARYDGSTPIVDVPGIGEMRCDYGRSALSEGVGRQMLCEIGLPIGRQHLFQIHSNSSNHYPQLGHWKSKRNKIGLLKEVAEPLRVHWTDKELLGCLAACSIFGRDDMMDNCSEQSFDAQFMFDWFEFPNRVWSKSMPWLQRQLEGTEQSYFRTQVPLFNAIKDLVNDESEQAFKTAVRFLTNVPQRKRALWVTVVGHPCDRLISKFYACLLGERLNYIAGELGGKRQEIERWEEALENPIWSTEELRQLEDQNERRISILDVVRASAAE